MAVLPASPPRISLDTLLTRAQGGPYSAKRPDRPADRLPPPASLAALERAARLAPASEARRQPSTITPLGQITASNYVPLTPPDAIVLLTTVATCECGRVHRLPNTSVFVRYGHDKSIHFTRAALPALPDDLPRERKTHDIRVPFCEECF